MNKTERDLTEEWNHHVAELVQLHADRVEEYRAELEEYRLDGYSPRHCFHGTYLWVDYDVMCGPCEMGDIDHYSDEEEVLQWARDQASRELGW
jgi:hypothetical protein